MVYCSTCGTNNDNQAAYCANCGTSFQPAAKPNTMPPNQSYAPPNQFYGQNVQQPYQPQPAGPTMMQMGPRKDPTIALLIAFLFPGFGYAYIDDIGKAIGMFLLIFITYFFIIGFFIHIFTMFDCYNQTKQYNMQRGYYY